jgi:hypothetical protein
LPESSGKTAAAPYFMLPIQERRSSSETFPPNRRPSSHFPLSAFSSRIFPLRPMPLLEDVQKGIRVIFSKS